MNVKNLSILLLISTLTGCSIFSKAVVSEVVESERIRLELMDPTPLKIKPIEWYIITPENQIVIFDELKQKYDPVLYGLTDDEYQDLSENMVNLRNFIIEQRNIIKAYKDYYESTE